MARRNRSMNGIFQISMEADMVDKIILGQSLKGLRESAGLSQKQLADCLSIGQSLVSKIEAGECTASSTQIEAICNIVCYPADKLLYESQGLKPDSAISYRLISVSIEGIKAISAINRIFLNQMKMDRWETAANGR